MALRGRDEVVTFGAPTRGLTTGNRTFALSDGAALVLTVAATSDRTGRVYDGSIAPDRLVVEPDGAHSAAESPVLAAAVAWLRPQGPSCSATPSQ
jgi:C-terminal processing protease CtpA/Prc